MQLQVNSQFSGILNSFVYHLKETPFESSQVEVPPIVDSRNLELMRQPNFIW